MAHSIFSGVKTVTAPGAPAAVGPYCHAKAVHPAAGLLFASGQLGLEPETGALPEGVEAQARQGLKNLGAVLSAAGYDYKDVVKTTVFLKNMGDFGAVNAIYGEFFPDEPPARSCVAVAELPKGALFEIEAIAAK